MLHGQQQQREPQLAKVVPKATPIRASSHPHLLTRVACSSDSATTNSLRTSFCWTSAASRTQLSKRCFPNRNLLRLHLGSSQSRQSAKKAVTMASTAKLGLTVARTRLRFGKHLFES